MFSLCKLLHTFFMPFICRNSFRKFILFQCRSLWLLAGYSQVCLGRWFLMLKTSGSFPTVMGSRTDIAGSPITLSHIPGSQSMWECASYRISAQCRPDNCHVHVLCSMTPPPPEYTPAEVQGFPYHEMVWVGPLANL